MSSFCIHYCNINKINREDILTYITYEILEAVQFTTHPIIDEQLLFQAERKHILENQTCMHLEDDISSQGLNAWDDVEQSSGMRKITSAKLKNAAYVINKKNATSSEIAEAKLTIETIRKEKIRTITPIYKKFDTLKELFKKMNIDLTDPRLI